MLQKISTFLTRGKRKSSSAPRPAARIIPREEHDISRQQFSRAALDVLYGLHKAGYQAFAVGGCLRDLLTSRTPKDFDVATDASPEQVQAIFRRSRIIGRRFRIVHVLNGRETIEVSTFRALTDESTTESRQHARSQSGLILRDNVFGSIEEDALRRDFTVNALYYNIADFSLYDFAGSLDDIKARRLRLIGDPETRYREDPVRMLRAARFAAKLGFTLDIASEAPIRQLADLLLQVPAARLFDEQLKLFLSGHAQASFAELERLGLFAILFADTARELQGKQGDKWRHLINAAMLNTDTRLAEDKRVTPAFLLAVLLWPAVQAQAQHQDLPQAITRVLGRQVKIIAIPKRFTQVMREMWELQPRLEKRQRPAELVQQPKFRAAYDFLLLREDAGLLADKTLGQWWTQFQQANPEQQNELLRHRPAQPRKRRRRRKPAAQ
jgi:poly(A) polymerase